jgi:GT2 family glycosyltransferase
MEQFAAECAQLNRGETLTIEVVPLFCGLLRRKVWDEVGGLDEDFKIGTFEDDDFSLRVRNAGYRIVTAEDCFIHHFGNGSFGKMDSEAFVRIFAQNKRCFESKWHMAWRPHTTRPGVKPIAEDSRITVSEFFDVNDGGS